MLDVFWSDFYETQIGDLKDQIAELEKSNEYIRKIRSMDKIKQLESLIEESLEVIRFYGNRENWHDMNDRTEPNNATNVIEDRDEFGKDKWNDEYFFGGKRARDFLNKIEQMKKD